MVKQNKELIIAHMELLSCANCKNYKQQIRSIDFYNDGQIRINTLCDSCGMLGFIDLYDDNLLPQIETSIKPEKDLKELVLQKFRKKRLKEIKKKEKVRQVIK